MPGNDRDEHGCIPSAGYAWCEEKQACIRPWMENCTSLLVGNDSDEHGCKASAGYIWCRETQKCIRPWMENCTIQDEARAFCGKENVANVFVCGVYIRVVSSLTGGGSTFYSNGAEIARCPVVAPDSMSSKCRQLLIGNNCVEQEINCTSLLVGNDSDEHGCKASAGYSWCAVTEKCTRQWEEPCKGILTFNEAWQIAVNSSCMRAGNLTGDNSYNNITKTWWLDLDTVAPGCAPACVVMESNRTAEANWRCTGTIAIPIG